MVLNSDRRFTSILPDELLYTAFTYLDSVGLGRACRISYRWHAVGSDPYLLQKHPLVGGRFKEKIVYDMITSDSNDVDYLIGLSTPIFRALKIHQATWCLYTNVTWNAVVSITRDTAQYTVTTNENMWQRAWYSAWYTAALHSVRNETWYKAWQAALETTVNAPKIHSNVDSYLHMWKDHGTLIINQKAYQIAACLVLLSANQSFCRTIQEITKDASGCAIPEAILETYQGNPWIKQYVELFHPSLHPFY